MLESNQESINPEYAKQSKVAQMAIKQAILVANSFLTVRECGVIFVDRFNVDPIETSYLLQQVKVKFDEPNQEPKINESLSSESESSKSDILELKAANPTLTTSDASQTTSSATPNTSDATPFTSRDTPQKTFDMGWTNRKPKDRVIFLNKRFQVKKPIYFLI